MSTARSEENRLPEMSRAFVLVVLGVSLVSASCPTDCRCPSEVPVCAAGASLMVDSCGCCKVCARQLFENCSKRQPCDTAKGLECNFGGGLHGSATGICRAKSDGRTCEFNSRIYQNGETFRPNCKHQCTCMDGAVGCISLCPQKLLLSKVGCAKPKRVKVWGQCCEQLICPDDANSERSTMRKHSKDRTSEDDLPTKNDLLPVWTESKSLPSLKSHPMSRVLARGAQCVPYTTPWSPCSKSCNPGVTTRVTNNNIQCKLVTETRACEMQPCKHPPSKRSEKCNQQGKATFPVKLSYAGCRSLKKFQLRDCGSCSDGQCCRPNKTQTPSVRFRCKNGDTFRRKVMLTESCSCDDNCSSTNQKPLGVYKLFNDIYKSKM